MLSSDGQGGSTVFALEHLFPALRLLHPLPAGMQSPPHDQGADSHQEVMLEVASFKFACSHLARYDSILEVADEVVTDRSNLHEAATDISRRLTPASLHDRLPHVSKGVERDQVLQLAEGYLR
eukprot:768699-Hanusia_phi.AAC.4